MRQCGDYPVFETGMVGGREDQFHLGESTADFIAPDCRHASDNRDHAAGEAAAFGDDLAHVAYGPFLGPGTYAAGIDDKEVAGLVGNGG